nr:hypothetical protein [Tanacetum cinerariifolium]
MVAYLSKSDASKGFNQIIDFLNGSSIKYALTVNPNIYVSCIKQFWTTIVIKQVNDVTTLQDLVDKKKVVVTEATIREALRLDDEEGVDCLPNEEIFAELARMGYEKPSTKLTFYTAFFSSQWKFLIHTILQCMSAKKTSWNEFSSLMASAVICLSSGRKFNFSKYIFDSLVRNVDNLTKFYMYPRFLQLMIRKQIGDLSTHTTTYTSPALTQKVFANMRRVCKGFSRVETPLFESMLVEHHVVEEGDADENDEEVNAGNTAEGDVSAAHGEVPTVAEEPSIPSPTPPTPPPQPSQDTPLTSYVQTTPPQSPQGRMIAEMDQDADVVLEDVKEDDKEEDESKPVEVQEVVDVITTAKLITEVITAASETVTAANEPKPLKKQAQIEQDEQFAKELEAELNRNINWDEAIDHIKRKAKEDPTVKKYQVLKRKLQTEGQARKNMIVYLKNVAGFKMDYFKGMSCDDIRSIFEAKFNINVAFLQKTREDIKKEKSRALKRINETPTEKVAKRQKLNEEVEELKRHLQIHRMNMMTFIHKLPYLLESLVKERFSTAKPKNFSDDFLLVTLGAMFENPDIHAYIWKTQRNVHGPAKSKDGSYWNHVMLNVVRLEVEEESEVSLELLRFIRQQHQEGQLE